MGAMLLAAAHAHASRPALVVGVEGLGAMLLWIGVLLALVVSATVGLIIARRKLLASDEPSGDEGFTLASLRKLRDAGQLTESEFESARQAMIGRVRGTEAREPASRAGAATRNSHRRADVSPGPESGAGPSESDRHE